MIRLLIFRCNYVYEQVERVTVIAYGLANARLMPGLKEMFHPYKGKFKGIFISQQESKLLAKRRLSPLKTVKTIIQNC